MGMTTRLHFRVVSPYKECSWCNRKNIPVVMDMMTGAAICEDCTEELKVIADTVDGPDGTNVIRVIL